jgi:hypothetical protein
MKGKRTEQEEKKKRRRREEEGRRLSEKRCIHIESFERERNIPPLVPTRERMGAIYKVVYASLSSEIESSRLAVRELLLEELFLAASRRKAPDSV